MVINCPKWTLMPVFLASERTSACSRTESRSHVPALTRPSASFLTADKASGLASISVRESSFVTSAEMSASKPGFSNFIESAKRALTSNNWPTICFAVGSDSSSTAKSSKPDNGETCSKLLFLFSMFRTWRYYSTWHGWRVVDRLLRKPSLSDQYCHLLWIEGGARCLSSLTLLVFAGLMFTSHALKSSDNSRIGGH